MDLPSFLWLWKIAAWSMGLSLTAYCGLAISGIAMAYRRQSKEPKPAWWRTVHLWVGFAMVTLVLGLLVIGVVGTLGEYGRLGHSIHGVLGAFVVGLTLLSAAIALQIGHGPPWARTLHVRLNIILGVAFLSVLWTGWTVVQKYLPKN
jgi:ABC-type tungstate transport system substrate-binding protein